jgi:hypothetical protein
MRPIPIIAGAFGCAVALGALAIAAPPAQARVVVGFGFGVPAYYPPPVVYAPPPVVYAPAPAYAEPTAVPAPDCRTYPSQVIINGIPQQAMTTSCLQPDGTWRVMP